MNPSLNGHHSTSVTSNIEKPKVIQSPTHSDMDHEQSSSPEPISSRITTDDTSSKPIREAKKRSLIYTGNTREFLETAIAAGIMEDIGDEEDEDNEYVPPGGTVCLHPQRSSSPSVLSSSAASSCDNEDESVKNSDDDEEGSNDNEDEDEEDIHTDDDENEDEKKSGDEMISNEKTTQGEISWNVRNRPQRSTHLIRFDNISQQDGS